MEQIIRKTLLTTTAFMGFANMSLAEEPIRKSPVEIVRVSTQQEDPEEKKAMRLILIGIGAFVTFGLGACAYNKMREKKDDYDDY